MITRIKHLLNSGRLIAYLFILSSLICASYSKAAEQPNQFLSLFPIENYPQKLSQWLKPADPAYNKHLLTPKQQKAHNAKFFHHYFGEASPWHSAYVQKVLKTPNLYDIYYPQPRKLYQVITDTLDAYSNQGKPDEKIGYGANTRPYTEQWFNNLKNNLNLAQFRKPQRYDPSKRAIATDNLQGRNLPTEEVWFYNPQKVGEGYPFDMLQTSNIWTGTPLYILGETADQAWVLVRSPRFVAWVKSTGIARVNEAFIRKWKAAARNNLVAITQTQVPVIDTEHKIFRFSAYIGMVFPGFQDAKSSNMQLLIPVRNAQGQASIHHTRLSKKEATLIPLAPTIRHFWQLMTHLIGRPYGWGGMYFYSDCASELRNLFVPFGIWIPIHSLNQVDPRQLLGTKVDLSTSDIATRLDQLSQQGRPFMTIIHINGHVMLYLGTYPDPRNPSVKIPLTYQNLWALRPTAGFEPDRRSIVGQSLLFPLLKQYPEDSQFASLAAKPAFTLFHLDQIESQR